MIPRIISEQPTPAPASTSTLGPGSASASSSTTDWGGDGETSVIGNNVKLYQGVTLRACLHRDDNSKQRHLPWRTTPPLCRRHGSRGETVIGRGLTVGGNVWLVKSVPPGSKVRPPPRRGQQGLTWCKLLRRYSSPRRHGGTEARRFGAVSSLRHSAPLLASPQLARIHSEEPSP